jgi:hypothetical protein
VQKAGSEDGQNYYYAFAFYTWNDKNYNPKYDIICAESNTGGQHVFSTNISLTDTKVPIYTNSRNANYMFNGATKLQTINKLVVKETTAFSSTFVNCTSLQNISIEGAIGKSISFADCSKLSEESIMSILNALSTTVTGQTLTLNRTAVINAFGSTESLEQYMTNEGLSNWGLSI